MIAPLSLPRRVVALPSLRPGMRTLHLAASAIGLGACLLTTIQIWQLHGLFSWIAFDFGNFWAGAVVFLSRGPAAVYDRPSMEAASWPLAAYYAPGLRFIRGPLSYPPVVMLAMAPLGWLPPVTAYAAWMALSALTAVGVLHRLVRRLATPSTALVLALLSFQPIFDCLLQGQVTILLMLAVYCAYRDFERGRELRAGTWLGLLACKPQYAVVLGLVLLWKRRLPAALGMAASAAILALVSVLLLGWQGVPVYLESFKQFSGFRGSDPTVAAGLMINWRGLLLSLSSGEMGERLGTSLMAVLGVATLATLPLVWRGRWQPRSAQFSVQFLATLLVTLVVSPHSHVHGATLLVVPGMIAAARRAGPPLLHKLMWLALLLPPVLYAVTVQSSMPNLMLTCLMLAALSCIVWDAARAWRGGAVSVTSNGK